MLVPMAIAVATLALSAGGPVIAVRIEEARDVRPDEVERLSAVFAELIRASDRSVEVWNEQGTEIVLALKIEGAPTKIRLIATLTPPVPAKKLILDIPREERAWRQALLPLALDFFPSLASPSDVKTRTTTTTTALTQPPPLIEEPPPPWPYVAFGVSLISAGAGTIFGLASVRAKDRLETEALAAGEIDELRDAANDRALAANVLVGTAIIAATAGVVLWVFND